MRGFLLSRALVYLWSATLIHVMHSSLAITLLASALLLFFELLLFANLPLFTDLFLFTSLLLFTKLFLLVWCTLERVLESEPWLPTGDCPIFGMVLLAWLA